MSRGPREGSVAGLPPLTSTLFLVESLQLDLQEGAHWVSSVVAGAGHSLSSTSSGPTGRCGPEL